MNGLSLDCGLAVLSNLPANAAIGAISGLALENNSYCSRNGCI